MLMALWSLVWHWNEQGCPSVCSSSAMPSFEGFSEVVGSIVMTAGFISPFIKRPATTDGGDVRGNALERLLVALADQIQPETPEGPHTQLTHLYTVESVMEVAGRLGLVDIICSGKTRIKAWGTNSGSSRDGNLWTVQAAPLRSGAGKMPFPLSITW